MALRNTELPAVIADPLHRLNALGSPSFLVFVRDWWEGRSRDVVAIWRQGPETRIYCEASGEVFGPLTPKVLRDATLPGTVSDDFVARALSLGMTDICTQSLSHITTHYDDHFAVGSRTAGTNYYKVAGGRHDSAPTAELVLDLFFEAVPTLPTFYAKQQRRRR